MSDEHRSRSSEDADETPKAVSGAAISGVVRGASGAPLRNALVSLDSDAGVRDIAQKTGDDGTFRFANLRAGRYVVNVHHGGGSSQAHLTVDEQQEHEVTITTKEEGHGHEDV
ncbi:MAG TPA: carboxypeptidase-like regulatory domain-containing protein [Thermoanaerobaculia bacterium]|nr:carboxypeptidase-like regulatory domain-containing protein [Thermoanaerobaculia bacterium]